MTQRDHTTSISNGYTSLADFPYHIKVIATRLRIMGQAEEAKRLKKEGKTAKQIAERLFGSDSPSNVRKVFRYLREVK